MLTHFKQKHLKPNNYFSPFDATSTNLIKPQSWHLYRGSLGICHTGSGTETHPHVKLLFTDIAHVGQLS